MEIQKDLHTAEGTLGITVFLEPLGSEEETMSGSSPGQSSQASA